MKISILILTATLLISSQAVGQKKDRNYTDLTVTIDSIIENNHFNGVALLIKDSTVVYSRSIGYSDIVQKTPIVFNDQFVIGSISKQITAVLVLREYEKGTLELNDKINQYLIKIDQPWSEEVTVHQLLTHTHGIVALDQPLEFKQGSQFQYSQLGFELLAQILEKVTDKSFKTLSSELFKQYGLDNTFHPLNNSYKRLVKGYEENEKGVFEFSTESLYNYVAAGSFISNAQDLSKWNQLLHTEKLVKNKTLALMKTRYATRIHPIFDTVEYGYGLLFKKGEENIQIGALGYAPGFVSASYFYPKTNMNLIILENTARDLNNFRNTFKVHTEIMELMKNEYSTE
ncbi:MAG: beta-lactamase family protein [Chitinophagales bacterium]|nr:beta-lactamase family protein [Chitinophagales bacterium]